MAYDLLTTSGINGLISDYINAEGSKRLTPLATRRTKYQNLNTTYSTLSTKLDALKSVLSSLKDTTSSSAFAVKSAASSDTNFATLTPSSSSLSGSYSLRINQLAKNDMILSEDQVAADASTIITAAGTHEFTIKAGDGFGGQFVSKVSVTFDAADFTGGVISNQKVMEKIQSAINDDKAEVLSSNVSGSTASSGSFNLNLNGTTTTIDYTADTYTNVIDSLVSQINNIGGITAEKVDNGGTYQLKLTVSDPTKYITIDGDTGTLLSELGVSVVQEKGATGLVGVSVFSPASLNTQFSLTSKNSGYDYRIQEISDTSGNALVALGLNLGTSRTSFVQNVGTDTPGYVYATTDLNSKFEFNSINVERNSNSITDIISGSTLNLKSVMQPTDTTVSLSVDNDTKSVRTAIENFVTKFNDVYKYIKDQSKTSSSGTRGILLGDSTASSLLSLFSSTAYSAVSGISASDVNSLSKLGITFNPDTGLSVSDSSQLDDKISQNIDQVAALFNSASGVATTLYSRIDPYLGSSGYINNAKASFDSTLTTINDTITSTQNRIDKSAEVLRSQYQRLQTQLAILLNSQSLFSTFSQGSY